MEIISETIHHKYRDHNGNVLLTFFYQSPILKDNTSAVQSINYFLEMQKAEALLQEKSLLADSVEFNKYYRTIPFESQTIIEITYNQNNLISFLKTNFVYAGGAHPNTTRSSYTFSLTTGEQVNLINITKKKPFEIKQAIINIFLEKIKKNPEQFFPEAINTIENTPLSDFHYYINDNGIIIYFNPYEIAPYVAGFVEAKLDLNTY
ncbi:DUF3298 and DUF4163 domain-containing protein [Anaeromicropila populeti]|nr:DUF3298 and DUF4163 domain-containing protein [Anaeromicropila populeti]